jgi:hypothetical protein
MDVRFLLDEHVDHAIALALGSRGVDAITVVEAGLLSADDLRSILPLAYSQSRVLVTRDVDFLEFHHRGFSHAGIVFWPGKRRLLKPAIRYLLQLTRRESAKSIAGQVRYIKDTYP